MCLEEPFVSHHQGGPIRFRQEQFMNCIRHRPMDCNVLWCFTKFLPKPVGSKLRTCCPQTKAHGAVYMLFFYCGSAVHFWWNCLYCSVHADLFSSSSSSRCLQHVVASSSWSAPAVFQSSLGQSPLILLPPGLEVGTTNKIWAVQLLCGANHLQPVWCFGWSSTGLASAPLAARLFFHFHIIIRMRQNQHEMRDACTFHDKWLHLTCVTSIRAITSIENDNGINHFRLQPDFNSIYI